MSLSEDLVKEYKAELDRLEWKYIQSNADVVRDIRKKQTDFESEVTELQAEFETKDSEFVWWSDLLDFVDENKSEQFIRKITLDIKDQYKDNDIAE